MYATYHYIKMFMADSWALPLDSVGLEAFHDSNAGDPTELSPLVLCLGFASNRTTLGMGLRLCCLSTLKIPR